MQRISLEIYTSAYEAVKILQSVADQKVELDIPVGSVLLDNILNLRIIMENAKKNGKEVSFSTNDPYGKNLIKILSGESDEVIVRESVVVNPYMVVSKKAKLKLPAVGLPRFKVALNLGKAGWVVPLVLLLLAGLGFLFLRRQHRADITLYFSPEVLTKSVSVKVGDGLKTDLDKKVLSGLKISRSLEKSLTADATGTKLEGEKAKGKVTLYNSTLEDITLKKGIQLTYKNKDHSYVFTTADEVKVPKAIDNLATITKGTVQVSVTAESIGPDYNIKKDKELSVKGYKSSELTASSVEDFKGGSSKEVKIVAQADITKLEADLTNYVSTQPADVLKSAVAPGYSFIDKSEKVVSKNVVINNKVGDEKDQLSGSITAQVEGLSYSKNELADFMGQLSQNLVPTGYEFHSYNKDTKVDVLGNTEKTVLSPTEADLQVTFKFFISPMIDKTKVFNDITGKSTEEAAEILNSINDIKRVELSIKPSLPMFQKVPGNESGVNIETKIEE